MLASGNHINGLDAYSNEAVEVLRGWKRFLLTGLAIIDPNRPSRDIPFIIPSRQAGRPDAPFMVPANAHIFRVGLKIPKEIIWRNAPTGSTPNAKAATAQVRVVSNGNADIMPVTYNPLQGPPGLPQNWDAHEVHQVVPGGISGNHQVAEHTEGNISFPGQQVITTLPLATSYNPVNGVYAPCPVLALGTPESAAFFQIYSTARTNIALSVNNAAAAPTTSTGKKSAFILEIAGYIADLDLVEPEKAFYGVDALN